jgi:hypothetical protein
MYQIVAHKLRRSSSLDPALSTVGMIDFVDGISDNSSQTAESVAREMCLSKVGSTGGVGEVDSGGCGGNVDGSARYHGGGSVDGGGCVEHVVTLSVVTIAGVVEDGLSGCWVCSHFRDRSDPMHKHKK